MVECFLNSANSYMQCFFVVVAVMLFFGLCVKKTQHCGKSHLLLQ